MPKALFFSRHDCDVSKLAHNFLCDAGFDVEPVVCHGRNETIPDSSKRWSGDYIFCFRSYFILKADIIASARKSAINFHPGPPEHPGSGSTNFALLNDEKSFGVTAHLMDEKVDSGPILEVKRFPIIQSDTNTSLLGRTHQYLLTLFYEVVSGLISNEDYVNDRLSGRDPEQWSGPARKIGELDKLQSVNPQISSTELQQRIRAVHTEAFPLRVSIQGEEFVLSGKR